MNDIIKMAQEAGFEQNSLGMTYTSGQLPELLERFAALIRADEREQCAKVCDNIAHQSYGLERGIGASWCAVTIRERSNT